MRCGLPGALSMIETEPVIRHATLSEQDFNGIARSAILKPISFAATKMS
jgi:hypothetical protein